MNEFNKVLGQKKKRKKKKRDMIPDISWEDIKSIDFVNGTISSSSIPESSSCLEVCLSPLCFEMQLSWSLNIKPKPRTCWIRWTERLVINNWARIWIRNETGKYQIGGRQIVFLSPYHEGTSYQIFSSWGSFRYLIIALPNTKNKKYILNTKYSL